MDESTNGRSRWKIATHITAIYKSVTVISLFFSIAPSVFSIIEIESVELGFDGYYKRGRWAPLRLLVVSENEPDPFVGELEVEVSNLLSGSVIQTYSTPVTLTRTDRRRYTLHVFQPGTSTKLSLRLVHNDNRVRVEREVVPNLPKEPKDLFILALAPSDNNVLDEWHELQIDADAEIRAYVLRSASQKHLPLNWKGFDSIDLVVIHGESLAANRISTRQQGSLLDWVCNGGAILISGGSDFQYISASFLEPFLPVSVGELKTASHLPKSLASLGGRSDSPVNLIDFELRDNAEALEIWADLAPEGGSYPVLASRRLFGSGQIVCLAFDYSALRFSQTPDRKQFWAEFLDAVGKSPRHRHHRYEPHRRHAEKIDKVLKSIPAGRVPLFRMLPLFLAAYLLSIAGFTWWSGRKAKRTRYYWIGGFIIALFFTFTAIFPRHLLSTPVSISRYSILSVYSEDSRAHLETYIGAIASADSTSSIRFNGETYIRPLRMASSPPLHLAESKSGQICEANLSAWQARTYLVESFFKLPVPRSEAEWTLTSERGKKLTQVKHHLPGVLEDAGVLYNGRYMHLGSVAPNTAVELTDEFAPTKRLPPLRELSGERKDFAKILAGEGVLGYLAEDEVPRLVGWMNHSFLSMKLDQPVESVDETFVIIHLDGDAD